MGIELTMAGAEIFVPDGTGIDAALARTTLMGIGAHQDDLEIMTYHGIVQAFGRQDQWYTGVVVTDGGGSPRDGLYADYTDDEMRCTRRVEQKKAAVIGEYSAQVLLDYPSATVKNPHEATVVSDLKRLILAASPAVIYTHNLADKHDTHVAVALRTLQAVRELPEEARPGRIYGCATWRDLDWLPDEDKVVLDVSGHENVAAALVGVFDSQICGGKRYDIAIVGRRHANATFFQSHGTDTATSVDFAMDLTPLVRDMSLEPADYVQGFIAKLAGDVAGRIGKLSS